MHKTLIWFIISITLTMYNFRLDIVQRKQEKNALNLNFTQSEKPSWNLVLDVTWNNKWRLSSRNKSRPIYIVSNGYKLNWANSAWTIYPRFTLAPQRLAHFPTRAFNEAETMWKKKLKESINHFPDETYVRTSSHSWNVRMLKCIIWNRKLYFPSYF